MEQISDLKQYADTFSIDKVKVIEEFKKSINKNVFFNNLFPLKEIVSQQIVSDPTLNK